MTRTEHWNAYWEKFRLTNNLAATRTLTAEITVDLIQRHRRENAGQRSLTILDLGCGDGHVTSMIRGHLPDVTEVKVVGLDGSRGALLDGRAIFVEGVGASLGDARTLPFKDSSIDVVVSFGYASVASYFDSTIQNEVVRVLKEGGLLISDFENMLSPYNFARPRRVLTQWRRYNGHDKSKPSYFFSVFGVANYFAGFGLRLLNTTFTNCFPPVRSLLPSGLLIRLDRATRKIGLGPVCGRIFIAAFRNERPASQA